MSTRPLILVFLLAASAPVLLFSQTTAPALLPIPDFSAQARAQELIHKLYQKDFAATAAADRITLARLLIKQALDTKDDPAARYVALLDAATLAADAGDAATSFAAFAEITKRYALDPLPLKRDFLLRALANTASPADCEAVMRLGLDTADQAATVDQFDLVQQLANIAESAANKTRSVKTAASIQLHLSDLRGLITEFGQVRVAFTRLEKNPNDPDAHLAIGRFYALHKNQWPLGLPHLAESADETLAALAQKELATPADDFSQVQLGDAWWDYAQHATGLARTNASAHAADLYRAAQKTIQGITLARIQSRIKDGLTAPSDAAPVPATGVIDLLALIDPEKDAAQGKWSLASRQLTCEPSAYATLTLPYNPPEEFDLRVRFTRLQENGSICILLAAHNRSFGYDLDVKGEARFERVDGKISKDNPTVTPVVISNNHPYTLVIQVRNDRVAALLDGKLLTEWKTDYKDLSHYALWKIPAEKFCALGANNARITFQSVELIEVTGKGGPAR